MSVEDTLAGLVADVVAGLDGQITEAQVWAYLAQMCARRYADVLDFGTAS